MINSKEKYNKILIFSGTTEGRELSELLSNVGISHIVSVASEYGHNMMVESEYAYIHVGKMESDEMISFMKENGLNERSLIVDASHPYAALVSENIVKAAAAINAKLIRVYRNSTIANSESILRYANIAECAEILNQDEGNILLTTGSKEIDKFCQMLDKEKLERVYARVLPSVESIELCKKAGIPDKNIIAMHGPFSVEMNKALMLQYKIKHLVTKDSGANGGYEEKIEAALAYNCKCHVIDRPVVENGLSVSDAYKLITDIEPNRKISISLAGIGMGNILNETVEVRNCITNSDAVFGAKRLISNINNKATYAMYTAKDIIPVIEDNEKYNNISILFSGDTGFYSGAKNMKAALDSWAEENNIELSVTILPGISSVAYLSAKLGVSYEDAYIYSLHGRGQVEALVNACKYNSKCFSLLSNADDIKDICKLILRNNINAKVYCAYNLSYDDEKIIDIDISKWAEESFDIKLETANSKWELATVLIINDTPERKPIINIKLDNDFIRDKVPMTKETVRHESILKLGLKEYDIVYDIGAGTGSVAIEIAGLSDSLKVYAIEKKPEAIELLKENIAKHNSFNIELIEGDALEKIKELEKPDAVFIGGTSGELQAILEYLASYASGISVVINAVSLETISEINRIIADENVLGKKIENVNIMQLAVSNVNGIGNYHLMQAQNPVMIFSFTI